MLYNVNPQARESTVDMDFLVVCQVTFLLMEL